MNGPCARYSMGRLHPRRVEKRPAAPRARAADFRARVAANLIAATRTHAHAAPLTPAARAELYAVESSLTDHVLRAGGRFASSAMSAYNFEDRVVSALCYTASLPCADYASIFALHPENRCVVRVSTMMGSTSVEMIFWRV